MPSRHARIRLNPDDPKIQIRNRYMEAIRAKASIAEATAYANASPDMDVTFKKIAPVEEAEPHVIKKRVQPTPGEREQLLPNKVVGELPPAPPAVDETTESVKRPMASPQVAVSTPAETKAPAETPPKRQSMKPPLPAGWDTRDYEWPKLRALCMGLGAGTPNSRGDAVKKIKRVLDGEGDNERM